MGNERPEALVDLDDEVVGLAKLVSPAALVEPALLREARLSLAPGLPASVEGRLWQSDLVEAAGHSGLVFKPEALQWLRRELAAEPSLFDRAVALVRRVHAGRSLEIELEERVIELALRGDREGVEREFSRLAEFDDDELVQRWAAYTLPRLPEEIGNSKSARRLGVSSLRAPVRGREISWMPRNVQDAEDLAAHFRKLDRVDLRIRRTGETISFGDVNGPGTVRISVPRTDPVEVEIEWESRYGLLREAVRVEEGETVRRRIEESPLRIRNLAGEVFRLPTSDNASEMGLRDERYRYDLMVIGLSNDREIVEETVGELRRLGYEVWSFHDGLKAGEHWMSALQQVVPHSRALMVALSEGGLHSGMTRVALDLYRSAGGEKMLTLRIGKVEIPDWVAERRIIEWRGSPTRVADEVMQWLSPSTEEMLFRSHPLLGGEGPMWSVDFDSWGESVVAACEDGTVRQWQLGESQGKVIGKFTAGGRAIVACCEPGLIAVGDRLGEIQILNRRGGVRRCVLKSRGAVTFLGIDARRSRSSEGSLRFGTDGGYCGEIEISGAGLEIEPSEEQADRGAVFGEIRLDKDTVVRATETGCYWSGPPWRGELRVVGEPSVSLLIPGGRGYRHSFPSIIVGTLTGTIFLLDRETLAGPSRVLSGHSGPVWGLACHPGDPRIAASASWDGTVRLWNVETGACRRVLPFPAPVNDVKFSPRGDLLAVACDDTRVYLCDVNLEDLRRRESDQLRREWTQVARVRMLNASPIHPPSNLPRTFDVPHEGEIPRRIAVELFQRKEALGAFHGSFAEDCEAVVLCVEVGEKDPEPHIRTIINELRLAKKQDRTKTILLLLDQGKDKWFEESKDSFLNRFRSSMPSLYSEIDLAEFVTVDPESSRWMDSVAKALTLLNDEMIDWSKVIVSSQSRSGRRFRTLQPRDREESDW